MRIGERRFQTLLFYYLFFIVAFNIYIDIAIDVQRNISRGYQTSELFHNQSKSLARQDLNEVSLENGQIASTSSEVIESTNKPSKEF